MDIDITSYLLGTKNSGGGGGDVPITDLETLNTEVNKLGQKFMDYLDSTLNKYEPYTTEPLTIYTPDATCKHFFIGKRSNQYRIIWGADDFCPYIFQAEVSQGFTNANITYGTDYLYKANFNDIKIGVFLANIRSGFKTMYSNYFNTVDDLITALKDNTGANITYTSSTSYSSFGGTIDSTWPTVITNIPIFQLESGTGNVKEFIDGKVLSKNLTIDVIS